MLSLQSHSFAQLTNSSLDLQHGRSVNIVLAPNAVAVILTTITAEIGATTSVFPFNDRMYDYLKATKRQEIVSRPPIT